MSENSDKMKEVLSISCSASEAEKLELEIESAFKKASIALPDKPWSFDGPSRGTFGYEKGWLQFFRESWFEILKIPGAVQTLAKGISSFLNMNRGTFTIRSNFFGAAYFSADAFTVKSEVEIPCFTSFVNCSHIKNSYPETVTIWSHQTQGNDTTILSLCQ